MAFYISFAAVQSERFALSTVVVSDRPRIRHHIRIRAHDRFIEDAPKSASKPQGAERTMNRRIAKQRRYIWYIHLPPLPAFPNHRAAHLQLGTRSVRDSETVSGAEDMQSNSASFESLRVSTNSTDASAILHSSMLDTATTTADDTGLVDKERDAAGKGQGKVSGQRGREACGQGCMYASWMDVTERRGLALAAYDRAVIFFDNLSPLDGSETLKRMLTHAPCMFAECYRTGAGVTRTSSTKLQPRSRAVVRDGK